jgi:hypothetical protein
MWGTQAKGVHYDLSYWKQRRSQTGAAVGINSRR